MALVYRILILLLFSATIVSAQNNRYNQQFQIITENDCYTSLSNDGYYTNGLMLSLQWMPKKKDSLRNTKFNSFEWGQLIYNAEDGHYDFEKIDRPITGYLYNGFQQKIYTKKQNLLKWSLSAGVIGKPAMGEDLQNAIHKFWHLYRTPQWKYQLEPAWGGTFSLTWSPQVGKYSSSGRFAFKPVIGGSVGNMLTHAMAGTALIFGRINPNSSTVFWGNHTGHSKKDREFFFYIYPAFYLKAYDATVQGNMFKPDPTLIPGKLNPYFFQGKAGFMYAGNRFAFGYSAVYENKQSLTQRYPQYYGSIQMNFMW